jgi:hypothetical protein
MLKGIGYHTSGVDKWHLGLGNDPKTDFSKKVQPSPLDHAKAPKRPALKNGASFFSGSMRVSNELIRFIARILHRTTKILLCGSSSERDQGVARRRGRLPHWTTEGPGFQESLYIFQRTKEPRIGWNPRLALCFE